MGRFCTACGAPQRPAPSSVRVRRFAMAAGTRFEPLRTSAAAATWNQPILDSPYGHRVRSIGAAPWAGNTANATTAASRRRRSADWWANPGSLQAPERAMDPDSNRSFAVILVEQAIPFVLVE